MCLDLRDLIIREGGKWEVEGTLGPAFFHGLFIIAHRCVGGKRFPAGCKIASESFLFIITTPVREGLISGCSCKTAHVLLAKGSEILPFHSA